MRTVLSLSGYLQIANLMKLTPSQKEAVTFTRGDSIIVAGAGSGKTLVLVEKVVWILDSLKVDPQEIVVITFTEKAAGELKERLSARFQGGGMFVGTIHAFAASLIRRHPEALDVDPEFQVMDEPLAILEKTRLARTGLIELAERGDPAALETLDSFGFRRSLKILLDLLSKNEYRPSPVLSLLLELKKRYQASKKEKRLLDFQDLEDLSLRLLEMRDIRSKILKQYRWIFVDEFQDTSANQWKLLSLLHDSKENRLVLVGDPRQSIYRFRGADPTLFPKARRIIESKGGKTFFLNENFRSQGGVIRLINQAGKTLFADSFEPVVPTRPSKGAGVEWIEIPETPNADERRKLEAERVAQKVLEFGKKGIAWDEIALLFRTRKAIPFFEERFEKEGIPYETRGGRSLLESREVVGLIFLFRSLVNPDDRIARTGLEYSMLRGIKAPSRDLSIQPLLEEIFQMLQAENLFPEERSKRNLVEFQKFLGRLLQLGVGDLKEIVSMVETLRSNESKIPLPSDGSEKGKVQILTVHAAKGLEFPVVFLCDLEGRGTAGRSFLMGDEGIILQEKDETAKGLKDRWVKSETFLSYEEKEKEEEWEESRRLLYVALTRATELLLFSLQPAKKTKSKSKSSKWSDWIRDAFLQGENDRDGT